MAYTKQTWATGDTITDAKLNAMETGIANADTAANAAVTPKKLNAYAAASNGKLVQVNADGTGFAYVALPVTPTAANLSGATATGKALMQAADAAAARTAIGAGTPYTLPAAAAAAIGGVKKGATVAAVATADAAVAAAATPTKAEYDKLVALSNETKKQLNALIVSFKAAGSLA